MRARALILLLAFLMIPCAHAAPQSEQGLITLTDANWKKPIPLEGEWEFYWNQLLTPEDFAGSNPKPAFIRVPGLWSQDPAQYPVFGHATYRLRVELAEIRDVAVFLEASIWSTARIYLDGRLMAVNGTVGTDAYAAKAHIEARLLHFTPRAKAFDIVIQVSNFDIFLCGITIAPEIGSLEVLSRERQRKIAIELFVLGTLFIMGMYHICIYLLRREDASALGFGLLCFCVSFWASTSRTGALLLFFPDMDLTLRLRIYNISWLTGVTGFCWFLHALYPALFARSVAWLSLGISSAFACVAVLSPMQVFVPLSNWNHFTTGFLMIYAIVAIVRAWRRGEEGARLVLIGMMLPIVTAIHDMLAIRQIINSPPITGFGVIAFIFFQSFLLARRFSKAFAEIKVLNATLEKKVEEKVRDIRSIMKHIPIGIFMIDRSRRILSEHSRKIHEIFDPRAVTETEATALIFAGTTLDADQKSQAISCLNASLDEDLINFDINQHTLPRELQRGEQFFEMTWDAIATDTDAVDKILVTMRDVTDFRRLERESRGQQQELAYIGEIINVPPPLFLQFMATAQDLMAQSFELLTSLRSAPDNQKLQQTLFIHMHTLKGSARGLYFKSLVAALHEVEQRLQKQALDLPALSKQLDAVQQLFVTYREIARDRLGRKPEDTHRVEYQRQELEELYQRLKTEGSRAIPLALQALQSRIFKDATELFNELLTCVPTLARDLGKVQPHVQLQTYGISVGHRAEEMFRRIFVHLIRNTMDHGLESAAERQALGKDPQGTIFIHMERSSDHLVLTCFDDGRGLNLPRLERIARSIGLNPQSDQEIAACIFHPGLSTAQAITDISGRGIGMHAVQQTVERSGGQIHVQLSQHAATPKNHSGFQLVITLPFTVFTEHLPLSA